MDTARNVGFFCLSAEPWERLVAMRVAFNRQELLSKSDGIHDPLLGPGDRVRLLKETAVVEHQIAQDLDALMGGTK